MKILNTCLLLFISFYSCGQSSECNQLTKGGKRAVPKDVCIPDGYNIREIFECGDVNLDGLDDYAFNYTKIKPKDGDTTYVGIYYATSDTTFILKEVYPNLYPIVFMRYDFEYTVKDSLLNEIQGMYNGNYPLNWIKFLQGRRANIN